MTSAHIGPHLTPSIGEYPIYTARSYATLSNDELRVREFRAAIETVAPDRDVVDIGTGGELLWARSAAESGARSVVAIEAMRASYEQANGLLRRLGRAEPAIAERIRLVHGDSTALQPGTASVAVAEIIGSFASAEGAAAVIADARRRYLSPGAVVVPDAAATVVAAAHIGRLLGTADPSFDRQARQDLSAIFAEVGHRFDVRLRLREPDPAGLLSDSAEIERLEFNGTLVPEQHRIARLTVTEAGRVDALLAWLRIGIVPGGRTLDALRDPTSWASIVLPFEDSAFDVVAGDVIEVEFRSETSDDGIHPDYRFELTQRRDTRAVLARASIRSEHHGARWGTTSLHRTLLS